MSASVPGAFVRVKLWPAGRAQTFAVDQQAAPALAPGDDLIVETEGGGAALGKVTAVSGDVTNRGPANGEPVQRVLRRATPEDIIARLKQQQREQDAYRVGLIKIREHNLPMKLTRVEQVFDGSRLVFYFTAEGRVDFRDLVRDLAAEFRTRIEMRQIGVRDEARMLGGYGSCGRPLCCAIWLQGFEPISIKMAKQQELSLNPWKLSGLCGRLKCCLRYELPPGKDGRRMAGRDRGKDGSNGDGNGDARPLDGAD